MKKLVSLFLTAVLLVTLSLCFYAEEELVGTDITTAVTMNFNVGEGKSAFLRDRNLDTVCSARDRFELLIASETPIYGVYLIWNTKPASWKLTSANEAISGGVEGYLHEYKPLSGGTAYTLTWDGPSDAQLAEIYFLSEGSVPEFVQVWEAPHTKADILMLPVLSGEEFLYFGGVLPYYGTELGLKVQVAYLLNADAARNHELLNGLWYAGLRNYPVFSDFSTQTTDSYTEEDILKFMVETLRRFKPEVVLGPDLAGNGGDAARMQFAAVLSQQALTAARDGSQFTESTTEYGVWQVKKCYLHLYGEGNIFLDWSAKTLNSFGGKTAFAVAQSAYGYHVSQQDKGLMSLDDPLRGGNGLFGLYSTTVGTDVDKNDFLENIPAESLSNWVEPEPEPETPPTEEEPVTIPQDTTVSIPQTPVPQKPSENKSDFPPFLLWTIVVIGAVSLIGTVVLICKSGKRRF